MSQFLILLLVALCCSICSVVGAPACTADCVPPACVCSGNKVPYADWASNDPPQIIALIFEGSLSAGSYPPYYQPLFTGLVNPNNCPATGTFFIDHEYTDYTTVFQAWLEGHDIGVQSVTNTVFSSPTPYDNILHEIKGEAYYLNEFALLNNTYVLGERAPNAASGGNNQFQAIVDSGLLYDATLVSRRYDAPFWPYTLDYQTTQDCQNGPCPDQSFPGLWEFPVTDLIDGNDNLCNNLLQCVYNNSRSDALSLLTSNYAYYQAQTTPFIISVPLGWLFDANNVNGLKQFLTAAVTSETKKAYVVSLNKALDWLRAPVKEADIATFAPWLCDTPRSGSCSTMSCNFNFTGQSIYMNFCFSPSETYCPSTYPWIDNLPFAY